MSLVAAHLLVTGLVQGVGYRYFCMKKARSLNITGWVRNRPDGAVELTVEGDKESISTFVEELQRGPAYADVRQVGAEYAPYSGKYQSFEVTG